MTIPLWTKLAAISLVAGIAFAWSTVPSVAQLIPSRIAVIDGQTQQLEQVQYRRKHARQHRRVHRDLRRHRHRHAHRHVHRHRDRFAIGFGFAVPYLAAPAIAVAAPPVHVPAGCGSAVVVRHGDTLARIAAHCGTTIGALLSANPQIYNPHVIFAGQVIRMPWA